MNNKRKIKATFANGEVATRTTSAAYTHASRKRAGTQAGRGAVVRFHTTEEAARAAAGRTGEVVAVEGVTAAVCVVCGGERFVSYGPSATDGSMSRVACHRCNA